MECENKFVNEMFAHVNISSIITFDLMDCCVFVY